MRAEVLLFAGLFAALAVISPAADADPSRRLFDFTPISAENPVVITIDDHLLIPLSELRAYRDAERLQFITDPTSLAQRRAVAEDLVTEYLQVDAAYRAGADRQPGFVSQMAATRTMILTDFIAARAEAKNSHPDKSAGDATLALADQLFEATDIRISNEAFALVRTVARELDQARLAPAVDSSATADRLGATLDRVPPAILVRYADQAISVRQLLALYAGLPANRPDLQTQAGLIAMLKPLIIPELMAREAARQGMADDPLFQHKLVQNQNALLRFHMQDLIDRDVNAAMREPDHDARMRAWHAQHRANYGPPREHPGAPTPTYEAVRAVVEGDYSVMLREKFIAERAQALRQNRRVVIDEAVLSQL